MTMSARSMALVPAVLFVLLCLPFVPRPGLQHDEVLFAGPLYDISTSRLAIDLFGHPIPLMLMPYLGCLKTWVYAPIFAIADPDVWSVRLPAILIAAVTILLTFRLLLRWHGAAAAWIGSLLLATDVMYVLTSAFDWGPVVIQQCLGMAAIGLVLSLAPRQPLWKWFVAGLLVGLALWNKALFLWTMTGVAGACAVFAATSWRNRIPHLSARTLAVAVAGLAIGASPLIIYGFRAGFAAISSGSALDPWIVDDKALFVVRTLDGSGLFDYLVPEPSGEAGRQPSGVAEGFFVRVADTVGPHRRNAMPWLLVLSLAAVPWIAPRARRIVGFLVITGTLTWIVMAMTRDAGASVHHVILLWPIPHIIIGLVAAELSQRGDVARRVVAGGMALAVCLNVLVVNQYLVQMIRFGTRGSWTVATHELIDTLRTQTSAGPILVSDWGIDMPLRVASRGALTIITIEPPDRIQGEDQRAYYRRILETPGLTWVTHADTEQIIPARNAAVEDLARQLGFSVRRLQTIADAEGQPIYEMRVFSRTQSP